MQQRLSLVKIDSVEPRATNGRRGEGRGRSCLQERSVASGVGPRLRRSSVAGVAPLHLLHALGRSRPSGSDFSQNHSRPTTRSPYRSRAPQEAARQTNLTHPTKVGHESDTSRDTESDTRIEPCNVRSATLRCPDNIGTMKCLDERDVTTMMDALFDIKARVTDIHTALFADEEDDDGDSEEPPLGEDDS
jgi:hypothetical protein